MEFQGKTVVVVPARVDAARASALDLAAHGAHVVLVDSNEDILAEVAAEIRAAGGEATPILADPQDPESLEKAAVECAELRPSVHVLVICHLEVVLASFENTSVADWRRMVDVNLLGPVFTARAFLPLLKRAGGAAIVHVSSFDGILGNPLVPSLSAVKGAMTPLTHVMAEELAAHGVRVNLIARGMTAPPEQDGNPRFAPLIAETPLGRPGRPSEIASAVRFLASSDASYVTGATLVVDGGRTSITPGTRHMNMDGYSPMQPVKDQAR